MGQGTQFPSGRIATPLWLCIGAHVLLAIGTHLSADEAHYAQFASHLALSYYDHPPLVGWLQLPAVLLGGGDLLLRLVPMAAWAMAAILLWRGCLELGLGQAAADAALLLLLLSFLHHLLGFGLVPDTLLLPLSIAVLMESWRISRQSDPALGDWLVLGLLLGLAGLSKYSAVLLVPGVLFVMFRAYGWRGLIRPGPWLAVALALIVISPVLVWNAQNQWASFVYQTGHASGSQPWQIKNFVRFSLAQVLLYGALPLMACVFGWRALRQQGRGDIALLCLAFALPGLLVTLYLSGRGATLPHWTSWAWLCLFPLAGAGWTSLREQWQRLSSALVGVQATICGVAMICLLTAIPSVPFADLHGWDQAAEHAAKLAREQGVPRLAVTNWSLASRVAWYARPLPLIVVEKHHDQYDRWFGRFKDGDDAIWIDWSIMSFDPPVRSATESGFTACEPLSFLPIMVIGREASRFEFMKCTNWRGPN